MPLWTVTVTALALSVDAVAVALARGTSTARLDLRAAVALAAVFGAFQAGMPLLGGVLADGLRRGAGGLGAAALPVAERWLPAVVLAAVGVVMLHAALTGPAEAPGRTWGWRTLVALGAATSLDALSAGFGLSLAGARAALLVPVVGLTTFLLSLAGVVVGARVRGLRPRRAAAAGGLVLMGLGLHVAIA